MEKAHVSNFIWRIRLYARFISFMKLGNCSSGRHGNMSDKKFYIRDENMPKIPSAPVRNPLGSYNNIAVAQHKNDSWKCTNHEEIRIIPCNDVLIE